ncbi:uncharacterized protein PADG_06685 [Paracoccidioides brasiliensis Pb18]|uniref:N-acetyltransferase domain-containing protein n=2 Tax=Paracoccidioides brasiliensis TaxID=121759 RepID=C1GHE9_PARBD|nr:uncharacterized protein PADG_06685 [Paracoccidioides brasiliensis Pb18]EEH50606.1 hypothetical protein PADG_06685 [Paracoccidioides brasiliensis Pb18]ODH23731.1 hypothetical protein ACO22_05375 [Paracoccidioides brasiliensis]ODH53334.1 hypothetical protein GX48_00530 [Paracoccidioides brasiliensis]
MANFFITKVEVSDWDEIVEGHFSSFVDEQFQLLLHGSDTPRNRQLLKDKMLNKYTRLSNSIWLKAVDQNSKRKIAGMANYTLNPTYVLLQKLRLDSDMPWLDDPEDKRIMRAIFDDVADRRWRHVKEAHIQLDTLYVLPEYRGLGIAGRFLEWGRDLADHLMVPITLESSMMAHPLYLKYGFVDVEHSRVVMGKWDIEYYQMKLEPKSTELQG